MIPLPLSPKIIKKGKNQATIQIDGLYPGYGVTVGNVLRRVLISSLEGAAVTQVKIKGVQHEFSTIPGVLEDVVILLLNIKNLRFKIFEGEMQTCQLKLKGEKEVRGSDFKLPSQIKLVNPECHIATITDKKTELEIEIQIEKGIGYVPKDQRIKKKGTSSSQARVEIGNIALDAIFTPIKNVNFQIENMRVGERTDFERLNLDVETDGTITPEEAFLEVCQIILKHFSLFAQASLSQLEKVKVTEKKSAGLVKIKKTKKPKKTKEVKKRKK